MQAEQQEYVPMGDRLLVRLIVVMAFLALSGASIRWLGERYGSRLVDTGLTTSTGSIAVTIGQDRLEVPQNLIRFDEQRQPGKTETLNLELLWPTLEGYSSRNHSAFIEPREAENLVFVELSQSIMSRDMTGRLEPIYEKLFEGEPAVGPAGLTLHRLMSKAGYGDEVILVGTMDDGAKYVVRCTIPAISDDATPADCQRDIHIGQDLSLLYRFSSRLLPMWKTLDARIADLSRKLLKT